MRLDQKLLQTVILDGVWLYGPANLMEERWGEITFLPNGGTSGYDHPNELGFLKWRPHVVAEGSKADFHL